MGNELLLVDYLRSHSKICYSASSATKVAVMKGTNF
jgi:hypothetical protein